jgi:hypothetical protein
LRIAVGTATGCADDGDGDGDGETEGLGVPLCNGVGEGVGDSTDVAGDWPDVRALAVIVGVAVAVGWLNEADADSVAVGRGVIWSMATVAGVCDTSGKMATVSPFHTAACLASGARAAKTGLSLVIEPIVVPLSFDTEQRSLEPEHFAEPLRSW